MFHRGSVGALKARIWIVGILSPKVSFRDVRTVASAIDDDFLASAVGAYGGKMHKALTSEGYGADGSILKDLLAWLSSPEGQAFIKFIFSLFGFMI